MAEEWAPYRIVLVSSCFVMPSFSFIRTPCSLMFARSMVAGCGFGGICLNLWDTLAYTHAWKNPTALDLPASI